MGTMTLCWQSRSEADGGTRPGLGGRSYHVMGGHATVGSYETHTRPRAAGRHGLGVAPGVSGKRVIQSELQTCATTGLCEALSPTPHPGCARVSRPRTRSDRRSPESPDLRSAAPARSARPAPSSTPDYARSLSQRLVYHRLLAIGSLWVGGATLPQTQSDLSLQAMDSMPATARLWPLEQRPRVWSTRISLAGQAPGRGAADRYWRSNGRFSTSHPAGASR